MWQENDNSRSSHKGKKKLNHYQKKVADRQQLEAVFRDQVNGPEQVNQPCLDNQSLPLLDVPEADFDISSRTMDNQVNEIFTEIFTNNQNIMEHANSGEIKGPMISETHYSIQSPHKQTPTRHGQTNRQQSPRYTVHSEMIHSPHTPPIIGKQIRGAAAEVDSISPRSLLSPSPVRSPQRPYSTVPTVAQLESPVSPYVPSGGKNIASYVPSVGKNIKFSDPPPTEDYGDREDNVHEELTMAHIYTIFDETEVLEKQYLETELESYCEEDEDGDDDDYLFRLDQKRIRLLTLVGKYSDNVHKNQKFNIGFRRLFDKSGNDLPDLKDTWSLLDQHESFVRLLDIKVTKSLRWLFVILCLTYQKYLNQPVMSLAYLCGQLKKIRDKSPLTALKFAVNFNAFLDKHVSKPSGNERKKRQIGDSIIEDDFIEPSSPVPKRKKRARFEDEDDSDASSIVSNSRSPRRIPPTSVKQRPLYFEDRYESLLGIRYQVRSQIAEQSALCTARPNIHFTRATKDVVLYITAKATQYEDELTFSEVINELVKGITRSLFGKAISNQAEICSKIKDVEKREDKEALSFCINVHSLIFNDNTKVDVAFSTIRYWCDKYCFIIQQILSNSSQRISDQRNLQQILKQEQYEIINEIKNRVSQSLSEYLNIFNKLAKISDWCIYIIFGLSLNGNGDKVDYEVLTKSILSCWYVVKKIPTELSPVEFDKLNKVFWCVPLARLTGLGGIRTTETKTKTVVGIDDFFDDDNA